MEYVYKLNLHSLRHLFTDAAMNYFEQQSTGVEFAYELIKYKNFKLFALDNFDKYELHSVILFYKNNNHYGDIHVDTLTHKHMWGLNWVVRGTGTMEYWNTSSIDSVTQIKDSQNRVKNCYKVSKKPDKSYTMGPGVYLVYANIPHRASGNDRLAISVRTTDTYETSWEDVVRYFSTYMD